MIKHRADSIQKLNDEQAAEAKKDKTIAEQADTIELLKGCIMELASWLAISLFDVGVTIDGFWWSVIGSLIMAIVSGIVGTVIQD